MIRKNAIIKALKRSGAFSKETAKTFVEAGLINPNGFPLITRRLLQKGIIYKTEDNRYYIDKV